MFSSKSPKWVLPSLCHTPVTGCVENKITIYKALKSWLLESFVIRSHKSQSQKYILESLPKNVVYILFWICSPLTDWNMLLSKDIQCKIEEIQIFQTDWDVIAETFLRENSGLNAHCIRLWKVLSLSSLTIATKAIFLAFLQPICLCVKRQQFCIWSIENEIKHLEITTFSRFSLHHSHLNKYKSFVLYCCFEMTIGWNLLKQGYTSQPVTYSPVS